MLRPVFDRDPRGWGEAARYSSLGIYMVLCVTAFTFLGIKLDEVWQTGGVLTAVGAVLGTAAGFYGIFREAFRGQKK